MKSLVETIQMQNQRYKYWKPTDLLAIAVSGGADSMALLHALTQLPDEERPHLLALHVHHHLRESATKDWQLVEKYCQLQAIPLVVSHWQNHPESNIEAAARQFRYEFFAREMKNHEAKILLTGHHGDDQVETILMRLTRGSTLEGFAGMKRQRSFANGLLVRLLLDFEKEQLYDYCINNGVPYREDETNQTTEYARNRYRHQILPLLKQENRKATAHFNQFSEELLDLLTIAEPMIENCFNQVFEKKSKQWVLSIPLFLKQKEAMQRLILTYFLTQVWVLPTQRQHVEKILHLLKGDKPQASLSFSGGVAKRRYDLILFEPQKKEKAMVKPFQAEIHLNEWLDLPFNGRIGLFLSKKQLVTEESVFYMKPTEVVLPLIIRYWQPGDVIQLNKKRPFTKKISRILIDGKVPIEKRERVWVITDYTGKVLWVPDYATSMWLHDQGEFKIAVIKKEEVQNVTSRY